MANAELTKCVGGCAAGSPCGDCSVCAAAVEIAKEASVTVAAGEHSTTPLLLPIAECVTVEIGAGSEVTIIEPAIGPACAGLAKLDLQITIAQDARVRFVSIRECAAHGERAYHSYFSLAEKAQLQVIECRLGGGNISTALQADLNGPNASVVVHSALFAAETDHLLSEININHFASGSISRIITKGVLADRARIEYRGLVSIHEKTIGCRGEQHADALLLSPEARADLMPDLTIDANDVRCAHGATVSGLDEYKLYYLMSRGLGSGAASEAVARGFMATVLGSLNEAEAETVECILAPRLKCALDN